MGNRVSTMKALRLEAYGKALDVLRLEEVPVPEPEVGEVRVRVLACAGGGFGW